MTYKMARKDDDIILEHSTHDSESIRIMVEHASEEKNALLNNAILQSIKDNETKWSDKEL